MGSTFYETTRLEVAKTAVNNLVTKLLANNSSHPDSVRVSLVTFSNTASVRVDLTANEGSITSTVSGLKANGGTNWEDALETASDIKTREGASTSVVFVSDGDPTFRSTPGEEESGFQEEYDDETEKPYYGQGDDDTSGQCYYYAAQKAHAIVKEKGWELYSVAAFGNVRNMQQLVTDAEEQAKGHYFEASDSTSLNAAFDSIVTSITTTVSYTNVSIHDALSTSVKYVTNGAQEPTFTYKKNGEPWTSAPPATVENGAVVWNVGNLEQDVTYSVTFKVQLTKDVYDAAAPKDGVDPVTSVKTNSNNESKDYVQYQIKTDVNGKPHIGPSQKAKYESPTVDVPTSILHVSKTWDNKGWGSVSVPTELKVQIKQDDEDYKTVTLNESNGWKADVVVAAGPNGHKYSVVETNAPDGWDVKLPDGVQLQGLTSKEGSQEITNTITTKTLTIKKSVTGNFGDTSKDFSFTLTDASGTAIAKATAAEGTSEGVRLTNDGSFTLKNGQSLVVELPYGTTYKVEEKDPKGKNDTIEYTTSIDVDDSGAGTNSSTRTASSPKEGITKNTTITYTNKRDVTPDVGVDLGNGAPYVAVIGGIGIAGVIWMALKRRNSQGI